MALELTGLRDKVAVVTGAGRMRSVGRAIAVQLARGGCHVVLTGTGRPPERAPQDEKDAGWRDIESVADEIRALGRRATPVVMDVSDVDSVEALSRRVLEDYGRVDIVVNNAAAGRGPDRVPVTEMPPHVWDDVIKVNLRGTFLVSQSFARHLVSQGQGGSIINISSIGGKSGKANSSAYGASKAAIQSLTSSMAKELGGASIRVNAICPGIVGTGRLDDTSPDVWKKIIADKVPLGRAGTGQDIAWVAAFLASDQGAWVTGQSWNVDGGHQTVR